MKAITTVISLLLLVAILFTNCVKDNTDDCPDDHNLVLCFEYYNGQRKDIFTERIYAIDVLIYDANFKLLNWLEIEDEVIKGTRRKELWLTPGEYYIISWANNFLNRAHKPENFNRILFGQNLIYHNYSSESSDELHYAPYLRECWCNSTPEDDDYKLYRVTVNKKKVTHHTLSYMSAHRTINVYLKGFDQMLKSTTVENPDVSMRNLTKDYNCFLNRNGNDDVHYTKKSEEITVETRSTNVEEEFGFATFFVPHFDNESPVTLDITGEKISGDSYHYTLDMDHVLEKLELVVEDGDDAVIDILVELIDGSYVEVSLPSWKVKDVDPGFNVY